jgi:hypothetical protein
MSDGIDIEKVTTYHDWPLHRQTFSAYQISALLDEIREFLQRKRIEPSGISIYPDHEHHGWYGIVYYGEGKDEAEPLRTEATELLKAGIPRSLT